MERTRTFTWQDPTAGAAKGLQMAGIDYVQAMLRGELPGPPILYAMDFKMKSVEPGKAIFSFVPQEFHYNPIGAVHGGVITTILDSAMGCTVHSLMPAGVGYTTLELKVNFLRPINTGCGELLAEGKMINLGKRTALVEAQIVDAQGKIYSHAVSTCMILGG